MQNTKFPDTAIHIARTVETGLRGSNHVGMRHFNERIVLQGIRQQGAIPKADLARLTELSGQTVSVIVDRLIDDGLIKRQERIRGRIGQPSIPLALNPDGAFSIGLHLGRRGLEAVVSDFVGRIRYRKRYLYPYPEPDLVLPTIQKALDSLRAKLADHWSRTVGLGLAAPLLMHETSEFMGSKANLAMKAWAGLDLASQVQAMSELPLSFSKDSTAAAVAELSYGRGRQHRDFLYVFVGTLVGGGLVLGGHILYGSNGNAAAIGSMPLGGYQAADAMWAKPPQLMNVASGWYLEQSLIQDGFAADLAHQPQIMQAVYKPYTEAWLNRSSKALAMAATGASALLDLGAIVIDGSLHPGLIQALVKQTRAEFEGYAFNGIQQPIVLAGEMGAHARSLGAALLPLHAQFFPDKHIFLKPDA
jgi:predicted NBD/HSP70 family sugar kinase